MAPTFDQGSRPGEPRRGPRRYGPSTSAPSPSLSSSPSSPGQVPARPAHLADEPYLGGLDPDDRYVRPTPAPRPVPPTGQPVRHYAPTTRRPAQAADRSARDARPANSSAGQRPVTRQSDPVPTRQLPVTQPVAGRAWSELDQP